MEQFESKIICGDAQAVLGQMPDGVINCCISSPPYWALRDYGVDGQLGLEPTFDEYIDKLCTIYDEVKRVLRPDGTCWVNLGDTYWGGGNNRGNNSPLSEKQASNQGATGQVQKPWDNTLPAKSLCLIPQRFAIEMVNRGWILRNVIIWSKPNPMPSSAKDRFTVDFEYVYFFVKSKRYFFEPQYEAPCESTVQRDKYTRILDKDGPQAVRHDHETPTNPLGRNKRTTWVIPTQPTPEAHFATFPEELVRPMVKAGCPRYICKKCGKVREKIWEATRIGAKTDPNKDNYGIPNKGYVVKTEHGFSGTKSNRGEVQATFKGYTDCGCGENFKPGIALDPFVVRAEPARSRPRKEWTIAA